jgi:hypothetical protein
MERLLTMVKVNIGYLRRAVYVKRHKRNISNAADSAIMDVLRASLILIEAMPSMPDGRFYDMAETIETELRNVWNSLRKREVG